MKKTLLALSVMVAASSANAGIEIYNAEGVSVNMKGDIEIVYMNGLKDDGDMKQDIQDSDLGFDIRYALSDTVSVGAFWEFQDRGTNEGDAYVALYTADYGSIKVGDTCTALDDAGIGSDYQYGITSFFNNDSPFCGQEVIRYDIDKEMVFATFAIQQNETGKNGKLDDDSVYFDTRFGARVAGFELVGLYGAGEVQDADVLKYDENDFDDTTGTYKSSVDTYGEKRDETLWGAEATYSGIDKLTLSVAYYNIDTEIKDREESDTFALAATFKVTETVGVAAGWSTTDNDNSKLDHDNWYVNADYAVAPNSVIYAEIAGTDADHEVSKAETVVEFDDQVGFAVGVKVAF